MIKLQEYQRAVLTNDLPEHDLQAGDTGIVVMIHGDHAGYELEIFSVEGKTLDVVTVNADQVRSIDARDIWHVRSVQSGILHA